MFFIVWAWSWLAGMMIIVSSTYWMTGKSIWFCLGKGKWSRPCLKASLMVACKRSAARTKMRGESGSPCLTPNLHLKLLPGTRFSSKANVLELKIWEIQPDYLRPNPFCLRLVKPCHDLVKGSFKVNLENQFRVFRFVTLKSECICRCNAIMNSSWFNKPILVDINQLHNESLLANNLVNSSIV